MRVEPTQKRAMVFIDGQNLFHAARISFGYSYPNFDPYELAIAICAQHGWRCRESDNGIPSVHFYTGIPDRTDNSQWNLFWRSKLATLGRQKGKLQIVTRPVRYCDQFVDLGDGKSTIVRVGHEKGVDVRLALDVVRYANDREFDVAVIVSQDQDLAEVAEEVKLISCRQDRWINVACTYPQSDQSLNRYGIRGTSWIPFTRDLYDQCLDGNDYRSMS